MSTHILLNKTKQRLRSRKGGLITAFIIFVLITFLYCLFSYQQWVIGEVPNWDQTIFTQLARSYASFQEPIVPVKGEGFNLLGDHFHPLLIILGPIYTLFPHTFTLLVVQSVLFGLSSSILAYVCFKIFELIVDQRILLPQNNKKYSLFLIKILPYCAGATSGFSFGVSYGLEKAVVTQFHEIACAVPLMSLAFYYFIFQKYISSALWASLLVFVKEDLGLTVCAFGLVLAWRMWRTNKKITDNSSKKNTFKTWFSKNSWIYGVFLAIWGIFWTWLSMRVLLPALNTAEQYDYEGKTDIGGLISNPTKTIGEILTNDVKMWTVLLFICASAFAVFLSPLSLLALPTFAWRFLSPGEWYWGTYYHYDAVLMPIAFFCIADLSYKIYSWHNSKSVQNNKISRAPKKTKFQKNISSFTQKTKTIISFYGIYMIMPIALFVAFITIFTFPPTPLKNAFNPEKYEQTNTAKAVEEATHLISPNARVESDVPFMRIVDKTSELHSGKNPINTLTWVVYPSVHPPDYIARNLEHRDNAGITDTAQSAMESHPNTQYKLIYNKNGVQVAKRTQ